jgi:hypothetical protein
MLQDAKPTAKMEIASHKHFLSRIMETSNHFLAWIVYR